MNKLTFAVLLAAALGCGLISGVFFAFSTFTIKGIARLPAPQGIAAMQSINITAITPAFMTALFGTAALCVVTAIVALLHRTVGGAGYALTGSLLYLLGTIVVTVACNVPLNDMLAALPPDQVSSADRWGHFLRTWVAWNHVRTGASFVACALLILALAKSATNR